MDTEFTAELDKFLAALASLFVHKGSSQEVAVLTFGQATCETEYSNWDGGTEIYTITLEVSQSLYNQVSDHREAIEKSLRDESAQLMRRYPRTSLGGFVVALEMRDDPEWRSKAGRWLSGQEITNQGRVRSDSVAPCQADGLLFRSQPEIHLYRALKGRGIPFAPLPVFIRGGESYRRVEPDFVVFHQGRVMVLELDGQQFHHETPAEAHERLTLLHHEGAHIERINASECDTPEKAETCATQIVSLLKRLAANK